MAKVAIDAIAGRIPVIIGCTSFTAAAAIELAQDAQTAGADGVLFTPPPYAHPGQDEILNHYRLIDSAVDLPMVAYNWPRGTGVEIEIDTAAAIADLEHVVALKCSTPNTDIVLDYIDRLASRVRIFAALISPRGLAVLNGLGGDGYIDGGGIGAPFAVPFFESFWSGDLDAARDYGRRWSDLTQAWVNPDFGGKFGSPAGQLKAAMRFLGQPGGEVRQPQLPVTDPDKLAALESVLKESGTVGVSTAWRPAQLSSSSAEASSGPALRTRWQRRVRRHAGDGRTDRRRSDRRERRTSGAGRLGGLAGARQRARRACDPARSWRLQHQGVVGQPEHRPVGNPLPGQLDAAEVRHRLSATHALSVHSLESRRSGPVSGLGADLQRTGMLFLRRLSGSGQRNRATPAAPCRTRARPMSSSAALSLSRWMGPTTPFPTESALCTHAARHAATVRLSPTRSPSRLRAGGATVLEGRPVTGCC